MLGGCVCCLMLVGMHSITTIPLHIHTTTSNAQFDWKISHSHTHKHTYTWHAILLSIKIHCALLCVCVCAPVGMKTPFSSWNWLNFESHVVWKVSSDLIDFEWVLPSENHLQRFTVSYFLQMKRERQQGTDTISHHHHC